MKRLTPIKKIALLALLAGLGMLLVFYLLSRTSAFDRDKSFMVLIKEPVTFDHWLDTQTGVNSPRTMRLLATYKGLQTLKVGYYEISPSLTTNALINKLKAGLTDPVRIAIENQKTIYDVCGKLGKKLQSDSATFAHYLTSPANLQALQTDMYNLIGYIPPNSYDFDYATTPAAFMERMTKNYRVFWTEERIQQAASMGYTPAQIITLASIVKAETAKNDEAPKIAQLYLNRLRIGMPLQSDPTATYGRQMEHVERVSNEHTSVRTAYNTYQFVGLPPGPIGFPETVYLKAVLSPEPHNFLYMCAQPEHTGYHNFSITYNEHLQHAKMYHRWLDAQGIR